MQTDRRGFLLGLGALTGTAAGLGLPLVGCGGRHGTAAIDRLTTAIAEAAEAESLGIEYLHRYPEESDLGELQTIFLSSLPSPREAADPVDALHQRIVRDFDEGATLRFGDWQLSRSELRLYAVSALRRREARPHYKEGFFPIERDGRVRYRWTGPSALLDVMSSQGDLDVRLRAVAPTAQTVTLRSSGIMINEITLQQGGWAQMEYHPPEGTSRLTLDVTPPWRPLNDFRTLGVQWGVPRAG